MVEAQAAPARGRSGVGRFFRVLGALVAVGVVLIGARAAVGAATLTDDHGHASYPFNGDRLVIVGNGSTSSLHITAGQPGRIEVDRLVFHDIQRPPVTQRMDGDRLQLGIRCPNFVVVRCEARYDLKIPAAVNLQIDNLDGDIRVSGITGTMDLRSDSGGINLQGGSGSVRLHNNDGAIRATGLAATTVDASSDSGSIRIDLTVIPQRLTARSNDGAIRLQVPAGPTAYHVDASSRDGRVTVDVPRDDDSPRRISATTDSASVTISRAG
jgi:hypothetical protein